MKIVSYKKKKSNIYEITLSNKDKICLYDDVILKYELLLKKELDDKELKRIIVDNGKLECYYAGLKYINTKLRTEKELRNKLRDFNKDAIDYSIARLRDEHYLNDDMYIKAYVNDAINLKVVGPNKILYELKRLGFKEDMINSYLDNIDNDIWNQKINKSISKKINTNHNLSSLMLKHKIIDELTNKGFYKEDILSIINNYEFIDDKKLYIKEYNKIKNKYIRKYSGEELEYRVDLAMRKKGFKKDSE